MQCNLPPWLFPTNNTIIYTLKNKPEFAITKTILESLFARYVDRHLYNAQYESWENITSPQSSDLTNVSDVTSKDEENGDVVKIKSGSYWLYFVNKDSIERHVKWRQGNWACSSGREES